MSGGVDSSVAAKLLCDQGFEVLGVTLKVWEEEDEQAGTKRWQERGCCKVGMARHVANLLHISHEGGILEDPWNAYHDEVLKWSNTSEKAPDEAQVILIDYFQGEPIKINGEKMNPVEIVKYLNEIGGKHGIGTIDIVENRLVGMKSRGVYETPGGTILYLSLIHI